MLIAATVTNVGAVERRKTWREGRWRRTVWRLAWVAALGLLTAKFLAPRALVAYDLYRARRALADVNLAEGLSWLQAAERRAPDRADVQFLLGGVCRRSGVFRPARRHLDRSLALGYSHREVERQEWMLLFQMGNVGGIEPLLLKLLQQGPSDELTEDIYEALVLGYLSDHRAREAGAVSDHWVRLRPESLRARLARAHLYGAANDTEKLQSTLREVLQIDPRRVRERLRLAQLLLEQKRVDEALAECEICRQLAPGDPNLSMRLGACYFQLGRLDEAKRELNSALLSEGLDRVTRLEALTIMGQIASGERDFEAAKRYCKEALELRPYDATAAYGLGMALSKLGEHELAQEYLKRSQRLLDQDQRIVEINHALIDSAGNVTLRLEMAHLLVDQGRQAEAAAWMQMVLRYAPECREAHEFLAEFYEKLAQPELAQGYREALAEMEASDAPAAAEDTAAAEGGGEPAALTRQTQVRDPQ
ncbi:MAG TPA: tetratricopeptide repeat protein [Pirellulales bacterium]|nr:tetratricopeptide repeat protein [Pirellulales bacterium]